MCSCGGWGESHSPSQDMTLTSSKAQRILWKEEQEWVSQNRERAMKHSPPDYQLLPLLTYKLPAWAHIDGSNL